MTTAMLIERVLDLLATAKAEGFDKVSFSDMVTDSLTLGEAVDLIMHPRPKRQ